jgi:hypothetical protein
MWQTRDLNKGADKWVPHQHQSGQKDSQLLPVLINRYPHIAPCRALLPQEKKCTAILCTFFAHRLLFEPIDVALRRAHGPVMRARDSSERELVGTSVYAGTA